MLRLRALLCHSLDAGIRRFLLESADEQAAEGKLPQATVIPATAGTPSTSTPTSASSLGRCIL
eukprot:1991727-Amphidinium_carterae.2